MNIFVCVHWRLPDSWKFSLKYPNTWIPNQSKSVLYHSFIASNFNYCPIVWHICGVINNNKLEKIQERSLRILFSDYESDVHDLLDSIGGQTLALRRLKFTLLEVYKCIKKVNSPCLHNLFNTNTIPYQLRTSKWFLCRGLSCIGYLYWYLHCKFKCIFLSYDCIFSHCTVYICTLHM